MITRETYYLETLKIVQRILTKGMQAQKQLKPHQSSFRYPTKKEEARHRKLISKQRRRLE
jgi:hypothetical protein